MGKDSNIRNQERRARAAADRLDELGEPLHANEVRRLLLSLIQTRATCRSIYSEAMKIRKAAGFVAPPAKSGGEE